jgi:hypothetical protein
LELSGHRERADLHQGHADVLRLYWAFFDREPDNIGAEYWIRSYNSCQWGTARIAQFFSVSPEFVATYGLPTDEEFVELAYANVLDRVPDVGGAAFWLDRLTGGQTRASMMTDLAFSSEFRAAHALPSDGTTNTGCLSVAPGIHDPVPLLVAFSSAWDAQAFEFMEAYATDAVINVGREWWQAPNSGVVSAITVGEAGAILADCGHPGSNETSCQFSVGVPGGGTERPLFNIVFLDKGVQGLSIIFLEFGGDGTS